MIIFSKSRLAAAGLVLAALLPLQASAGILDDDEARRAILHGNAARVYPRLVKALAERFPASGSHAAASTEEAT